MEKQAYTLFPDSGHPEQVSDPPYTHYTSHLLPLKMFQKQAPCHCKARSVNDAGGFMMVSHYSGPFLFPETPTDLFSLS